MTTDTLNMNGRFQVGDDRRHLVDIDDLVEIAEDDYCGECGQIGCDWGAHDGD